VRGCLKWGGEGSRDKLKSCLVVGNVERNWCGEVLTSTGGGEVRRGVDSSP
jgi:hypothetical protein